MHDQESTDSIIENMNDKIEEVTGEEGQINRRSLKFSDRRAIERVRKLKKKVERAKKNERNHRR